VRCGGNEECDVVPAFTGGVKVDLCKVWKQAEVEVDVKEVEVE
jgi:hypothetical protein